MPHIYLIGARGSGKTTVGSLLANSLDMPFQDLDHCLVENAGQTIAEIVRLYGWPEFRRMETEILQKVSASAQNLVIATGGGIILSAANRDFMTAHGHIVWLDAPARILSDRIAANPLASQRPALTSQKPADEIAHTLKERKPLYAACAQTTIDASGSPRAICAAIRSALHLS